MPLAHPSSHTLRKIALATSLFLGTGLSGVAFAGAPALVTSNADNGPGTLREALASGATQIRLPSHLGQIKIHSTLFYTGTDPLRIYGGKNTIKAVGDFTVLELTQGASLRASNLTLRGTGGYSFDHQGTGKGLFVQVPSDRVGTVNLDLSNITVRGVANHGIHVSDCTLGDDCGAGGGGGGDGSAASINAVLRSVTVRDAGNGKFDADGVRIDERADGDINFRASNSQFIGVGADGVELDEGNNGDVIIDVRNSEFRNNGAYCLPAPLNLAEPCVEDDDGELVLDLDDGFDIDEAGDGSVIGTVAGAIVKNNLDEGLDFDEEGAGGMDLDIINVDGFNNGDEAVKLSAANSGNVYANLRGLVVRKNGNDGTEFEAEDGDGQVHVRVNSSFIADNDSEGIAAAQENEADLGSLRIRGSFVDELDLENVIEE